MPQAEILKLARMGHEVSIKADMTLMGRGQMILRNRDGVLCGATEKRTDGQVMCF